MTISVILSTYNGESYISEQLDSILNQTFQNFKLYIRDDGSIDGTVSIIEDYQKRFPERIFILRDDQGNIGVAESFQRVIEAANSDYYLFADQDDVWDSQKIYKLVKKIREIESDNPNTPVLVFSDMEVIDEGGKVIYDSFLKLSKYKDSFHSNILFRGFIPGCSIAFNNEAKKLILGYKNLMLHDGFAFMMVNLFGVISKAPDKLIKYRLHSKNTIGLGETQKNAILVKDFIKYIFRNRKYRSIVLQNYFEQVSHIRNNINNQYLYQKEFYTRDEIENLNIFERKKWFLKHFVPFKRGFFDGLVALFLI